MAYKIDKDCWVKLLRVRSFAGAQLIRTVARCPASIPNLQMTSSQKKSLTCLEVIELRAFSSIHRAFEKGPKGSVPHWANCIEEITRAQRKKLKLQEDNNMNAYMEDILKNKIEEFDRAIKGTTWGENWLSTSKKSPTTGSMVTPTIADINDCTRRVYLDNLGQSLLAWNTKTIEQDEDLLQEELTQCEMLQSMQDELQR
ncbi:hypothetical protein M9H77_07907 [Catharanthus roseus]|uniref:Uncharacterized protein n=1 Tax=Catharanthus roseus TaxID=4058 RepID=A0ACC0BW81_CATRO|nr:hypothetical protein M9H77_07907 [Catharanthus roseus]